MKLLIIIFVAIGSLLVASILCSIFPSTTYRITVDNINEGTDYGYYIDGEKVKSIDGYIDSENFKEGNYYLSRHSQKLKEST